MRVALSLVAVWVAVVAGGVEGRRSAKHKRHVSPADSERGGRTNAGAGAAPLYSQEELEAMNARQLKAILQEIDLDVKGRKETLIERLLAAGATRPSISDGFAASVSRADFELLPLSQLLRQLRQAGVPETQVDRVFADGQRASLVNLLVSETQANDAGISAERLARSNTALQHTNAEDARRGQRYMGLASASVDKIGLRLDGKGGYQSLSAQDVTATRRLAWSAKHSVSAALELLPPSSKHWETAARLFLRAVNLLDAVGWSDDVYGAPIRFDELLLILSEASEFDGLHAVRDRLRAEMTGEQADNLERWIAYAPPTSSLPSLPVKRPPVHSRSNAYGLVSAGEGSSRDFEDPLLFSTLRLFSTPVSSINMLDVGIFSRDFNSRLSAAATKSYARFLKDPRAKAARGKPDTLSNLFYGWQGDFID